MAWIDKEGKVFLEGFHYEVRKGVFTEEGCTAETSGGFCVIGR